MKRAAILVTACLLALASCGDEDDPAPQAETTTPADQRTSRPERAGTAVKAAGSEFGKMLFGADDQAIYIFENDPKGESACYGDCAEAWPPVLTDGEPRARDGVRADLLGTTRRRDGKTQVTYAGKPLYFYAHEGPGEVRCHDVNLNGGFWWVVGPDGKRRP